tara:strand:- start:387 stop:794 length:408 start_codon:yes stop_codon:yes gene_type:complete
MSFYLNKDLVNHVNFVVIEDDFLFVQLFVTNLLNNTPNVYSSTTAPNVNPNSSLTLICNEAHNDFSPLGVLYSIVPQVSIGSIFTERPSYPIYLECKHGTFSSLTFRLVNSDTLMPIEILDPNICFIFSIKKHKN